ncbi:MAG: hypothetical protein Fur0046_23050 [Cyanobacteria bacterium J069]|nr:MAG: hypothetical protein D6742_04090 [Cyanobacteria bacterium J069]
MKNLTLSVSKKSWIFRELKILLCFILLSLFLRIPFFFKDVIDWDESTFILIGQSVLDGHLPYTDVWDFKPPLVAILFAGFIAIAGKSIALIRLLGAICVALVAWFTYLAGKSIWETKVGVIAGILWIISVSIFPSGQAVMTEHLALIPMMGAIAILSQPKLKAENIFGVSILMTLAVLIRLNLAYVSAAAGIFVVFAIGIREHRKYLDVRLALSGGFAYFIGSALVLFVVTLPYLITDHFSSLWESAIVVPLTYANSQYSWIDAFEKQLANLWFMIYDGEAPYGLPQPITRLPISLLMWGGCILGTLFIAKKWTTLSYKKQEKIILLGIILASTIFSIVRGGAAYKHYLIQLIPIAALVSAFGINQLAKYLSRPQLTLPLLLLSGLTIYPALENYRSLWIQQRSNNSFESGASYQIADYLMQSNADKRPVYIMTNHIIYWLIGEKPITRATTHPSNLGKEYLLEVLAGTGTTVEQELSKVLAQNPEFIVTQHEIEYLNKHEKARLLLRKTLKTRYRKVEEIDGHLIYRIRRRFRNSPEIHQSESRLTSSMNVHK